jgi:hypothetical protein
VSYLIEENKLITTLNLNEPICYMGQPCAQNRLFCFVSDKKFTRRWSWKWKMQSVISNYLCYSYCDGWSDIFRRSKGSHLISSLILDQNGPIRFNKRLVVVLT